METISIHIGMIHFTTVMDMARHIIHLVIAMVIHTLAWATVGEDHITHITHTHLTITGTIHGMVMIIGDIHPITIRLIITILLHIIMDIAVIV